MDIKNRQSGFTVIEIAVVMGILGALIAMGLFFDFAFYRGNAFGTDVDVFASVLRRARARAINNINETNHGVYITADKYVLFQGDSYGANPAYDENILRNPILTFTGPTQIIFSQLSGDSDFEGVFNIAGSGKSTVIQINNEGLINR